MRDIEELLAVLRDSERNAPHNGAQHGAEVVERLLVAPLLQVLERQNGPKRLSRALTAEPTARAGELAQVSLSVPASLAATVVAALPTHTASQRCIGLQLAVATHSRVEGHGRPAHIRWGLWLAPSDAEAGMQALDALHDAMPDGAARFRVTPYPGAAETGAAPRLWLGRQVGVDDLADVDTLEALVDSVANDLRAVFVAIEGPKAPSKPGRASVPDLERRAAFEARLEKCAPQIVNAFDAIKREVESWPRVEIGIDSKIDGYTFFKRPEQGGRRRRFFRMDPKHSAKRPNIGVCIFGLDPIRIEHVTGAQVRTLKQEGAWLFVYDDSVNAALLQLAREAYDKL